MRYFLTVTALAGLLAVPAVAQPATQPPASKPVCIDTQQIKNTTVPDSRTILFHMNNGKIWKNTLRNSCPGLKFHGFTYSPTPPHQLCSNLETIRVIEIGTVCMLGEFTPYTPPKPASGK